MAGDAERIRALRERPGKSAGELAALAALGDMAYADVELYDDELRTVLSLRQAKQLAAALGVATAALFVDGSPTLARRITYDELVAIVRGRLESGLGREAFEQELGWDLGPLFESESATLSSYCAEFFEELCRRVGVDWLAALP